jgi:hypothetical protein
MKVLDALRHQLNQRFPEASQVRWSQGHEDAVFFDWPGGVLRELVAAPGAGASLMMQEWLSRGQATRALLDAADGFDPASCDAQLRAELLWLRCRGVEQAMQAADLLLREGSVRTLSMDFRLCEPAHLRATPSSSWHRLRLLARRSAVCVLVCSPFAWLPCAQARWVFEGGCLDLSDLQQGRHELLKQKLPKLQRVA